MAVQEQHRAVVDALILAGANVDQAENVRTMSRLKNLIGMLQSPFVHCYKYTYA